MLTRRSLLTHTARLTLLAPFAPLAHAMPDPEARFVLVILRGGLDALAAVPAHGEPAYAALRGPLAIDAPLPLVAPFGLHPALTGLHALYAAGELSVLHAVATPYRERSHFDGQKVLEAGSASPTTSAGGWLNRALVSLAAAGQSTDAIALSANVPLVLRGPFSVASWAPSRLPETDDDTLARIHDLYTESDPALAARLSEALDARRLAGDVTADRRGRAQAVAPLVTAAARFLGSAQGPRVAVIDIGGWDTHANQGGDQGQLANRLRALDTGLIELKRALGEHWRHTSVLVVTEFGRTAAVNGTRGTDHGTAGCALLAGGNVAGGRVLADWPGLAARDLHEGRDLRATLDLRSVFKSVLAERFGVSQHALERDVFPDSSAARPVPDLFA